MTDNPNTEDSEKLEGFEVAWNRFMNTAFYQPIIIPLLHWLTRRVNQLTVFILKMQRKRE